MQNLTTIKRGSLLVADGTSFPLSVKPESQPLVSGWRLLKSINSLEMKELVTRANWHFFYIAAERKTTVWGRNKIEALQKAIQRITARTNVTEFNCLEIKEVDARRVLGISLLRVTARSRQIEAQTNLNEEGLPASRHTG